MKKQINTDKLLKGDKMKLFPFEASLKKFAMHAKAYLLSYLEKNIISDEELVGGSGRYCWHHRAGHHCEGLH
jgi:hypothetical protein